VFIYYLSATACQMCSLTGLANSATSVANVVWAALQSSRQQRST
jgi:hypothetical protein